MNNQFQLKLSYESYQKLQQLAQIENRSVEEQIIYMIENAVTSKIQKPEQQSLSNILNLQEERNRRHRLNQDDFGLPDSTEMIREDRER